MITIIKGESMNLSELDKGDEAVIVKMDTESSLKSRLVSFGISKGSALSVEACSVGKQTMEILVDGTLVGLRSNEAKQIEVKRIEEVAS